MLEEFINEEFDIIIQAGQSNSEGCGQGETSSPFVPNEKILYMYGDFSISIAEEHKWDKEPIGNFSLSFATEYLANDKLQDGRKLLVLRTAVGGTGFCDKRWGIGNDLFIRMMEMTKAVLALNKKNKLVALLWHQGETDAGGFRDVHYKNLTTLVNTVRSTFNFPCLPFVAGDFVNEWKTANLAACEPIIAAIKDTCTDIGNARFVETSELLSNNQQIGNGDTIHFSKEALDILGRKYFVAFCEITAGDALPNICVK